MRFIQNVLGLGMAALPVLMLSAPALAEEAEGAEGGLPQLNPALFPEQMFWLAVSFALLYVLMAFVALPRVSKTQGNRKKVIEKEIESARAANESAKASLASTEKALSEAREESQAKVGEMLAAVAEESNENRAASEKELLRSLRRAEEDIATTRAAALAEVEANAADIAKAIIDKILGVRKRAKA